MSARLVVVPMKDPARAKTRLGAVLPPRGGHGWPACCSRACCTGCKGAGRCHPPFRDRHRHRQPGDRGAGARAWRPGDSRGRNRRPERCHPAGSRMGRAAWPSRHGGAARRSGRADATGSAGAAGPSGRPRPGGDLRIRRWRHQCAAAAAACADGFPLWPRLFHGPLRGGASGGAGSGDPGAGQPAARYRPARGPVRPADPPLRATLAEVRP